MKPALVFPFNDPDGTLFPHLQSILPDLKRHFERAYICPPLSTLQRVGQLTQLQADDFFTIFPVDRMQALGSTLHIYISVQQIQLLQISLCTYVTLIAWHLPWKVITNLHSLQMWALLPVRICRLYFNAQKPPGGHIRKIIEISKQW